MMVSSAASAQTVPVPLTLEPNRVQDNLERPREPVPATPPLTTTAPQQAAPEQAAAIRFVWREIRIEGATAIPAARLMQEWKHAPGTEVSVEDVFRFANAITRLYGRSGYAMSFGLVPQQQITDGIITIRVVEGFVDRIAFTGAPLPRGVLGGRGPVAAMADRIKASKPLRSADLERYLLLINDLPGITARATLSPSPDTVGGSELTIEVTRQRRNADYGYNSYMPRSLGTHVVGGSVDLNGIFTGADRLRLGAFRSIGIDAYSSLSGDYTSAIGSEGLTLGLSGSRALTRPDVALLRLLDYHGNATTARMTMRYPMLRSRTENLALEMGLGMSDTDSELLGQTELRDRLRPAIVAVSYDLTDAERAATSLRLGMERGLKLMDARGNSRAGARPDYISLTMDMQRLQPVAPLGRGQVSLLVSIQGQVAARGPLFSAAQCSYGGRRFGRRFDAGVLIGDHCLLTGAELRWSVPVDLGTMPASLQPYGFVDGGRVWQLGALLPGEQRSDSAASAGAGLRLGLTENISGSVEGSRMLRAPNSIASRDGTRVLGNISFRF